MSGVVQGLIGSLKKVSGSVAPTPNFNGATYTGSYYTGYTYSYSILVSNATSASITSGSIPTGMTFSYLVSNANIVVAIDGAATTDGTYTFVITAINNPGGGATQSSQTLSSTMTMTTKANQKCTSAQISIGCCTSTADCGPYGAGVACSPASGTFDWYNAC